MHKKYTLSVAGWLKECDSLAEAQHEYIQFMNRCNGTRYSFPDGSILTGHTYYTVKALMGWVYSRSGRVVMK